MGEIYCKMRINFLKADNGKEFLGEKLENFPKFLQWSFYESYSIFNIQHRFIQNF